MRRSSRHRVAADRRVGPEGRKRHARHGWGGHRQRTSVAEGGPRLRQPALANNLAVDQHKETELWTAQCQVLKTMLKQHIREEEDAIFPLAKEIFDNATPRRMGSEFSDEKKSTCGRPMPAVGSGAMEFS